MNIAGIAFALLLSIIHFFGSSLSYGLRRFQSRLISFSAGISIAYVFLQLLPHIYLAVSFLQDLAFIALLSGFVLFHILEKYVYQHARRERLLEELKEVHSAGFFLYSLVSAGVLYMITSIDFADGLLFFVPMAIYAAVGEFSIAGLQRDIRESSLLRFVFAFSSFLGAMLFAVVDFPKSVTFISLGFVAGVLIYLVVRDVLPKEKKGSPAFFIAGVALYSLLNFLIRYLKL
ncbi:hypothetical protein D6825_01860 [Candidatus Woesearchaeota archaeon]|nr:MAG: hypothetical protein D6825_01860 [Candidatus Woesearchaeota archaeon]